MWAHAEIARAQPGRVRTEIVEMINGDRVTGEIKTLALRLGLTETGRVLFNLRASIKRELWRDFYISASMYDTFDNRPPEEGTIKNDVGTTLSIGWTF